MTPEYEYSVCKLECGHLQRIKKQHYKLGKFRCNSCQEDKFKKEAESVGLEFLGDSDSSYKRYKFKSCSHEKRMVPEQVRSGSFSCKQCSSSQLEQNLQQVEVSVLSKTKSKVVIRYNKCRHTCTTKYSNIAKNTIPSCKECRLTVIREQAVAEGLKLLDKDSSVVNTSSYFYELPCGCTKSLRVGNVKRGIWACSVHSNWWSKPSNIYLIRFSAGDVVWLKLGVSTDVSRRISDYKIKKNFESSILFCKQMPSYAEAVRIEKQLHNELVASNLQHETMKEYMTNGFSECYPENILDSLVAELKKRVNDDQSSSTSSCQ